MVEGIFISLRISECFIVVESVTETSEPHYIPLFFHHKYLSSIPAIALEKVMIISYCSH